MKLRSICAGCVLLLSQASFAEMRLTYAPFEHLPLVGNKIKTVKALCAVKTPSAQEQLLKLIAEDEDYVVVRAASECVGRNGQAPVVPALVAILAQPPRPLSFWPLSPSFLQSSSRPPLTVAQLVQRAIRKINERRPQHEVNGAMAALILKQIRSESYSTDVNAQNETAYTRDQGDGSQITCWESQQQDALNTRCVESSNAPAALDSSKVEL